jgi:hypothetical protein
MVTHKLFAESTAFPFLGCSNDGDRVEAARVAGRTANDYEQVTCARCLRAHAAYMAKRAVRTATVAR